MPRLDNLLFISKSTINIIQQITPVYKVFLWKDEKPASNRISWVDGCSKTATLPDDQQSELRQGNLDERLKIWSDSRPYLPKYISIFSRRLHLEAAQWRALACLHLASDQNSLRIQLKIRIPHPSDWSSSSLYKVFLSIKISSKWPRRCAISLINLPQAL